MTPAPLLPSSDEVEKSLERLDAFANTLGDEADDINTVILEVMRLQSENASLRAQMPAWEVFVKNWPTHSRLGTNFVSLNGFNIAEGHYNAIRALTRPTTPSPDEAKGVAEALADWEDKHENEHEDDD